MRNYGSVRDDIYDMVLNYIAESEELGFCNNCPNLYEDLGTYDCPYGLDCTSCEYSPASLLETDVDKIMSTIEACKP